MSPWEETLEELRGRERYMLDPKCIFVGIPMRYHCTVCGLQYLTTVPEHTSSHFASSMSIAETHFCSGKCRDEYFKPTVRRFFRRFMHR